MLIRRAIEGVRNQDWFIVGIEFFILVLGVFMGIPFSNWNEARLDQEHAQSYLERLHADLEADLFGYRDRLQFWRAVSVYEARNMFDCQPPSALGGFAQLITAISGNPVLITELRHGMFTMRVALLIGQNNIAEASQLQELIKASMDSAAWEVMCQQPESITP